MLTRAARKRQATHAEEDNEYTTTPTVAPLQVPAIKKRKVQKSNTDDSEKQPVKRVRRKGVLKDMLEMPLDILFEIFGELKPQDLLALSRTTKDFRNLLISKSSVRFWKAAFENAPELPPPFPGMNEIKFANLLFSNHCHNCFKPNIRTVFWVFRARLCNDCKNERLLHCEGYSTLDSLGILKKSYEDAREYLPVIIPEVKGRRRYYHHRPYFVDREWVEELKQKWKHFKQLDKEAFKSTLEERRQFIKQNIEAARVCAKWYSNKLDERVDELDQLRADRFSAILDRLRGLGYGVEIDKYSEETEKALKQEKLVREPKLLTDRTWLNLQSTAVTRMNEVRTWRIDKEYKEALRSRIVMVIDSLTRLRGRVYGDVNFPSPMDFLSIPCIRSIIEVPTEVTLTLEDFMDKINPMLPEILEDWQKSVDAHLVRSIKSKSNIPKEVDPLSIAIGQFFFCKYCSKPLIYPNVRAHSCTLYGVNRNDTKDVYESVLRLVFDDSSSRQYTEPNLFIRPRQLIQGNIVSMATIVEKVIAALGYVAGQTTLKEMEGIATLMVCIDCENCIPSIREVVDWRTMILHAISQHRNSKSFSARLATEAEVEMISTLEKEPCYNGSRDHLNNCYNHNDYYMCAHCDDLLDFVSKQKIKSHLSNNHGISTTHDEINECDVIESSDTFASFQTESTPFRELISDQLLDGGDSSGWSWRIRNALEKGYGVVCNFDELEKKNRRVAPEAVRLSEGHEADVEA
ncbi:hypothetical protein C8Q75DRAFT_892810 [Abortiporus biennis]|nr:hypothetical protein C8Q75DRAFT_892810 [Abortiporus biennis]